MIKNKYLVLFAEIVVLAVIALLAFTVLNSQYLFGWAAHNWAFYLILGLMPIFLVLLNKPIYSTFMCLGIAVGIFAGNYIGGIIKVYNESKITESMPAEEVYRLEHHPGFQIWLGVILLFLIVGIAVSFYLQRKKQKQNK